MKVAHNVTCTEPNDFSEKCFKITKLAVTIHIMSLNGPDSKLRGYFKYEVNILLTFWNKQTTLLTELWATINKGNPLLVHKW